MNVKLRKRLQQRKRRLNKRIDKSNIPSTPAILTPSLELQLAIEPKQSPLEGFARSCN
ncbi:MAG: hypothetical protein ACKN9S_05850 [Pirellula sp.]